MDKPLGFGASDRRVQVKERVTVTPEVVRTVASLARLQLDLAHIDTHIESMNRILALVSEMQAVETDGVAPLSHPLDAVQRLRPDVITEQVEREKYQSVAPETRDGLYLVPRVVE
ncbi:MAG: Asp-tRNA(Asn)/Glu-tRNA(Gln) amidotransferase subunit GatC [Pseudomonadales bacterium]|nr:Asp-tRNA(Asn)/Glu-tRNA(Gln) amidotransferase subunit GatC [Pseudomonadales bacterium]